ncbi:hypothetical protein BS17DRAFT_461374 [Gyrodon lividus]|nr:hypothetical protein BS17DRAFT_461374 [Gyrodon lividus]
MQWSGSSTCIQRYHLSCQLVLQYVCWYVFTNCFLIVAFQTCHRFQLTFSDTLSASQSIGTIRSVCPCKANPHPSQINRHPTILSGTLAASADFNGSPRLCASYSCLHDHHSPMSLPSSKYPTKLIRR